MSETGEVKVLRPYLVLGAVLGLAACGTAYGTTPDEPPVGPTDAGADALPPGDASGDVTDEEIIVDPCAGKDLSTDSENCGMCKKACGAGMTCIQGGCTSDPCGDGGSVRGCDVGGALQCVDTQTNQSHCGACGHACNFPCTGGSCDRLVFVTSQSFTGNLGGLAGADQKCQAAAQAATKKGTFKAWLSDVTKGPSTTFVKNPRKYLSVTGGGGMPNVIANNWADLTDGALQSPISSTELGAAANGSAWTATSADGAPMLGGEDCAGWTVMNNSGRTGSIDRSDSAWTNNGKSACGSTRHLYCFEQ